MKFENKLINNKVLDLIENVRLDLFLTNNLTNFMNPYTVIDLFFTNTDNKLIDIQLYMNSKTNDYVLNCFSFLKGSGSGLLNRTPIFLNFPDDVSQSILGMTTEIYKTNLLKTDVYNLIEILPEYQDIIEIFEVVSTNVNDSTYKYTHVPEYKLYYPEPYIASPSFQHEELWFIHILHYQH